MVLSRIGYGVVDNRLLCCRESETMVLSRIDYGVVKNRLFCYRE